MFYLFFYLFKERRMINIKGNILFLLMFLFASTIKSEITRQEEHLSNLKIILEKVEAKTSFSSIEESLDSLIIEEKEKEYRKNYIGLKRLIQLLYIQNRKDYLQNPSHRVHIGNFVNKPK